MSNDFRALRARLVACRACPRLVAWREEVARVKRRAYREQSYWGKPVPGFGDPQARLLIVGLAPGAHGANRTGRMFTGDRSGDFLYAALHRRGLASQPESLGLDDGLILRGCFITSPVHCVPPKNRPNAEEQRNCAPYLSEEVALLPELRAVLALGRIGFESMLKHFERAQDIVRRAKDRPRFCHGGVALEGLPLPVVASFHVSQQNTQTGRLTSAMFDAVLEQACGLAGL